jgi:predicted RecB family nuclease
MRRRQFIKLLGGVAAAWTTGGLHSKLLFRYCVSTASASIRTLSLKRSTQCVLARPFIAQGALQAGRWGGRADILRRIEKPSDLGAWSYEVVDTKLACETKGNTVLQICLYSDLLTHAQKLTPESAYVVTPGSDFKPQEFRYFDYAAFYQRVRTTYTRYSTVSVAGRFALSSDTN